MELLVGHLETEIQVSLEFEELDVVDDEASAACDLSEDDLVILSFFISEVCIIPESISVIKNLNAILRTISVGSRVLYNDSDAYSFYSFMNSRSRAVKGLSEQHEIQDVISVDDVNFDGLYEEYIGRYDRTPHLHSKAVSKIYIREK